MATLVANGSNDPAQAAFSKHAGTGSKPYASAVTPTAASPAGVSDSVDAPFFGSERIVDIIRREQHNQMQQARKKGTPKGAQKVAAVPHGSGEFSYMVAADPASCSKGTACVPACVVTLHQFFERVLHTPQAREPAHACKPSATLRRSG